MIDKGEVHRDGDHALADQYLQRVDDGLHQVGRTTLVEPPLRHPGDMHIPFVALAGVQRQRFDRADAVHGLDEKGAAPRFRLHCSPDLAPDRRQHRHQPDADQQAQGEDHRRHDRTEHEHDRQKDHDNEGIEQRPKQLAHQKRPDLVDFVHVMDDLAGRGALKKIDRQVQQLVEHVRPDLDVDARCDKNDKITAQVSEYRFE